MNKPPCCTSCPSSYNCSMKEDCPEWWGGGLLECGDTYREPRRGIDMIFDDVANVMNKLPVKKIQRATGMSRKRIYSLRCGCTFNLDYTIVAALKKMGYEVKLEKVSPNGDTD